MFELKLQKDYFENIEKGYMKSLVLSNSSLTLDEKIKLIEIEFDNGMTLETGRKMIVEITGIYHLNSLLPSGYAVLSVKPVNVFGEITATKEALTEFLISIINGDCGNCPACEVCDGDGCEKGIMKYLGREKND